MSSTFVWHLKCLNLSAGAFKASRPLRLLNRDPSKTCRAARFTRSLQHISLTPSQVALPETLTNLTTTATTTA